jgi:hypothetical protein
MNLLSITSAVVWIEFVTIILIKVFNLGKAVQKWYLQFGAVAVLSDVLVIVLGILLAQFLVPDASTELLALVSIGIQLVHDYLFYVFVILGVPKGQNSMIDLFKDYAAENSYKILLADSAMIGGSVLLAGVFEDMRPDIITFLGLLATYSLTYIIYTK